MEYTSHQLTKSLEKLGLKFKSFQLSHRGHYSVRDADWNYKDVPHLAVVHKLVDAALASVTDKHAASINMQKILGMRFPVTVFNYHPKAGAQTYFTTLFFYVLVIETKPIEISANETEVVTTYNIGATGYWMLFFPILKWLLTRNYRDLMSTDIPMRERRGQLRDWGFGFKYDTEECGFEGTIDISKTNAWPGPGLGTEPRTFEVAVAELEQKGEVFMGRSDQYGIRLKHVNGKVSVFPRLCPHEGACLDESPCQNNIVRCPWHLRPFRPLSEFELGEKNKIALNNGTLEIRERTLTYQIQPQLQPQTQP